MAIRETIGKYPLQTKIATAVVIIIALGVSIWHTERSGPANASKAYYTTDDGATTFSDDFFKAYPFDHDGKPAYRAYMFQRSSGKQFVGYLERYTPDGVLELQALLAKGGDRELLRSQIQSIRARAAEVKSAGDPTAQWYPTGSARAEAVTSAPSSQAGPNESVILVFP